ncbi:hypothetical protein HZ326_18203 [Fusarium oxysporum f. sp. albedinis]|nr:hypothetical protein HZ326_18203 [Fusarium oxysporum f. sp. albedinis]
MEQLEQQVELDRYSRTTETSRSRNRENERSWACIWAIFEIKPQAIWNDSWVGSNTIIPQFDLVGSAGLG